MLGEAEKLASIFIFNIAVVNVDPLLVSIAKLSLDLYVSVCLGVFERETEVCCAEGSKGCLDVFCSQYQKPLF